MRSDVEGTGGLSALLPIGHSGKEAILGSTSYGLDTEMLVTPVKGTGQRGHPGRKKGFSSKGCRANHMGQEQMSTPARPQRRVQHQ